MIAKYVGALPIQILAVVSSNEYMPRLPVGSNVLYVCNCLNCKFKLADLAVKKLENILHTKMGETSEDKQFSLGTANWYLLKSR